MASTTLPNGTPAPRTRGDDSGAFAPFVRFLCWAMRHATR